MGIEQIPSALVWVGVIALVAFVLDRAFLSAEDRGWIYYRKRGFGRLGSVYHLNELNQAFGGGKVPAIIEEVQQDEDGDPLGGPEPD